MTPLGTWSMAALLAAGMGSAALAATGNAGQTTGPASPTMSAPNALSHDGSAQLGSNQRADAGKTERQHEMSGPVPPPGAGTDIRHPRATDQSYGGETC